jgi:hypothetical protein
VGYRHNKVLKPPTELSERVITLNNLSKKEFKTPILPRDNDIHIKNILATRFLCVR